MPRRSPRVLVCPVCATRTLFKAPLQEPQAPTRRGRERKKTARTWYTIGHYRDGAKCAGSGLAGVHPSTLQERVAEA